MNEETKTTQPKRRRWGRRALIALGVFALALVALRLWWGWSAERELQAVVDEIRARAEPLAWKDFASAPVPDEQNAVVLYRKADAAFGAAFPSDIEREWIREGCPAGQGRVDISLVLSRAEKAMELCRQACKRPRWNWGLDYLKPALESNGNPGCLMELSGAFHASAEIAKSKGSISVAVDELLVATQLSKGILELPGLTSLMVSLGLEKNCLGAFETMLPKWEPDHGRGTQMMGALLARKTLHRTLLEERSWAFDSIEAVRRGRCGIRDGWPEFFWVPRFVLYLQPSITSDEAWLLELHKKWIEAASFGVYPFKSPAIHPPDLRAEWDRTPTRSWAMMLLPPVNAIYEAYYKTLARRHLAATALAMRLYELEHGKRPGKLEELVPKYLPAVPADPFARDGAAIRYAPDANSPVLYSVYLDGKDDGGKFAVGKDGSVDEWKSPDLVFFLNGDRPVRKAKQK